jgi:predicted peroxiredoxin
LDQSTRNHLSALDAFIKEQAEANKPIQPGEFSVYDYIEKMKLQGVKIGMSKAVRTMKDLVDTGVVEARKATQGGNQVKFYRFL